jgi:hypothetical protein
MSGILEAKSRVLDTIITQIGKRQLAQGGLDIRYVSFSDESSFYQEDLNSPAGFPVVKDPTERIALEPCNLPQDRISFDLNEEGKIDASTQLSLNDFVVRDGRVISLISGTVLPEELDPIDLNSIFESSIQNFHKLSLISTIDPLFNDDSFTFEGSQEGASINFNDILVPRSSPSKLEKLMPDIFRDPKFGGSTKYKFLPPIRKVDNPNIDKSNFSSFAPFQIAQYAPWGLIGGEQNALNEKKVFDSLEGHIRAGRSKTIKITESSRDNNLMIQLFDKKPNENPPKFNNLFFFNFGEFRTPEHFVKNSLGLGDRTQIIFAGKIHKKESGSFCFIHLFTFLLG